MSIIPNKLLGKCLFFIYGLDGNGTQVRMLTTYDSHFGTGLFKIETLTYFAWLILILKSVLDIYKLT